MTFKTMAATGALAPLSPGEADRIVGMAVLFAGLKHKPDFIQEIGVKDARGRAAVRSRT